MWNTRTRIIQTIPVIYLNFSLNAIWWPFAQTSKHGVALTSPVLFEWVTVTGSPIRPGAPFSINFKFKTKFYFWIRTTKFSSQIDCLITKYFGSDYGLIIGYIQANIKLC